MILIIIPVLIFSHNDFPITIRDNVGTELSRADLRQDLKAAWNSHTDIPRLREGKLGGQVYENCAHTILYKLTKHIAEQAGEFYVKNYDNKTFQF